MRNRSSNAIAALLALSVSGLSFALVGAVRADSATTTASPLPFHTIEGTGGGAITPTAYLSNPAPVQNGLGNPSFAISYVGLGNKSLTALTASETLYGRLELSVGADQFQLGSLPSAIQAATTVSIGRSSVWLYSYNARYLVVKESSATPAITFGLQYKDNPGIEAINNSLGGALKTIGYHSSDGIDYTLTASKLLPKVAEHALITTAGLRESKAADIGILGFGNSYKTTFEGSLIYLPASKFVVAYEFRQKTDPYNEKLAPVIGKEGNWNAFDTSYIVSPNTTFVAGYGTFGTLANTTANNGYWFQIKENL